MVGIIIKISAIFVMIFIGYGAGKRKALQPEAQEHLIDLLLNISIPCMLFCSMAGSGREHNSPAEAVKIMGCCAGYFIIAALVAQALVKLFRVKDSGDIGVYKILFTSINAGFIGFPVTKLLFDDTVMFVMVLHNMIMNLYLYSLGIVQLRGGQLKGAGIKRALKGMANPCIAGAAAGLVFLFAGIPLPSYAADILKPIGDAAIPVGMLVVGLQLSEGELAGCFTKKKLVLFSAISMLAWPLLVFLLANWLPLSYGIKTALSLGAALPPATTVSAMAADEGQNYKLAADGIIVMTLLSALSLSVIAVLLCR